MAKQKIVKKNSASSFSSLQHSEGAMSNILMQDLPHKLKQEIQPKIGIRDQKIAALETI